MVAGEVTRRWRWAVAAGAVMAAVVLAAGCGTTGSRTASVTAGGLAVADASVTEGDAIAAGYLTVRSTGTADRLVGASTPAAARVSLHRTTPAGAMVGTDVIEVPAGGEVRFAPGGDHLMFEGLAQPLQPGDTVSLTLRFEQSGDVDIEVPVVGLVDVLDIYSGGW